jgi:hypothetical protein
MRVDTQGERWVGMPQPLGDGLDAFARVQQRRGEEVPKRVHSRSPARRDPNPDERRVPRPGVERVRVDGVAARTGQEQGYGDRLATKRVFPGQRDRRYSRRLRETPPPCSPWRSRRRTTPPAHRRPRRRNRAGPATAREPPSDDHPATRETAWQPSIPMPHIRRGGVEARPRRDCTRTIDTDHSPLVDRPQ